MDQIKINKLEVFCNHGVFPEENVLGQKFVVSVILYTNTREAGQMDDLTKSIHYGEVSHTIKKIMEDNTYQLIETVAERVAEQLLIELKLLEKISLEIEKPWAPIGLPLESVSVKIERSWHTAYIALGSNMGDKKKYLLDAVNALDQTKGCQVIKTSDFIATTPYGMLEQDEFLNGALELKTLLPPYELLILLHEIEKSANRERTVRWGPRTLDLDILLYDDIVFEEEELTIPHIDMHNRDFVLSPLAQIASHKRHPVLQKNIGELKCSLEANTTQS